MRRVCCVCNAVYGEKDGGGVEQDSRGICPPCFPKEQERIAAALARLKMPLEGM